MTGGTLVIAELDCGSMSDVTAELVSAAAELDGPVTLGIIADDPASVGHRLFEGVDRVIGVRLSADRPDNEVRQRAVEALIGIMSPRTVLLALSWDAATFASAMAERGNFAFVADVVAVSSGDDGSLVATRQAYGGKVNVKLRLSAERPAVLLLRPGVWKAAAPAPERVPVEIADVSVSEEVRVRRMNVLKSDAEDAELTEADVIFGLGRGVGKAEHIAVFEDIARQLGVALGASRPLVDVGLLPRGKQIGQSGATVKPRLYVAFGVSGSLQHMAGVSKSRVIFAINTDKDAPIFDFAHLGSHVDAMEVVKHLRSQD